MKSSKISSRKPAGTFLAILAIYGLGTALLLAAWALPASASGDRGFAGFYRMANVTVLGDQVRLTFSARIINYSGADITSATLTLKGPGAPHGVYATFYGLYLSGSGSVTVSKEITIPAAEYERWKTGQIPLLAIQSAQGISTVELHRGSAGEE